MKGGTIHLYIAATFIILLSIILPPCFGRAPSGEWFTAGIAILILAEVISIGERMIGTRNGK